MTGEWMVVMSATGRVEHVDGGAPITWLGKALSENPDVPPVVREAAEALLASSGNDWVKRAQVALPGRLGELRVQLAVLEAVPLRRALTPVSALIGRTMETFLQQAQAADVELHVTTGEHVPPSLSVDGEKVGWALGALVSNAIRHAQAGKRRPAQVHVDVGWDEVDGEIVVRVSDTGPGIPHERARWLFERDPGTGQSTGTALRVVADVIEAHRGSVAVTTRPGDGGAIFTVRLPRH